jgi:CelD/BcsL family acetyltransferase involved in cellulose biosynthesis
VQEPGRQAWVPLQSMAPMEIRFLHDLAAWEGLAEAWNDLVARSSHDTPFARFEFLDAWFRHRGGGEWPDAELWTAVALDPAGGLRAAAPFFTTAAHPSTLYLLGTSEIADYLDVLAMPEDLAIFALTLLEAIEAHRPRFDTIDLWNILDDSPSLTAFEEAGRRRGWGVARETLKPSPYIVLDGGWESYLDRLDKKQRHELRRKMRRAAGHPGGLSYERLDGSGDLEKTVDSFLGLMATDPAKAAFLSPEMRAMFHAIAGAASRHGWLRFDWLRFGPALGAGVMSFDYGNRIWIYNSGIDPEFLSYSPGWVLLGYLIQEAAAAGKTEVDFMRGGEDYKVRLGGIVRHVDRLTLSLG